MNRREFINHEVIFMEGEYQKWMYSISEGAVDIYSGYGTAKETKLATLTEGQYFGEIGMIGMMPRTASAVAAGERVVLELISFEDLGTYMQNHPEHLHPILCNVSSRIRSLTEDLSMITQTTDEVLQKKDEATGSWLAEAVNKLLEKLTEKNASAEEFVIRHRLTQEVYGEKPSVVRYHAGDVIFHAGDQADCMYEIYEGTVGIYSDYQTSKENLLTELSANAVFGEMGILEDLPRSATAVCLTDCSVLRLGKEQFLSFFQEKPMKILQILQKMCIRLRDLSGTYLEVSKSLKQLKPENQEPEEHLIWAKLENIRHTQLNYSMYNPVASAAWMYF